MAKLSRSEAGRLGAIATAKIMKARREEHIKKEFEEYEQNPKFCLECGKKIPFEKRFGKFCSKSCSASYTNRIHPKRKKEYKKLVTENNKEVIKRDYTPNYCLCCGKETPNLKFCSVDCQKQYEYEQYIKDWKEGKEDGLKGEYGISVRIKRYFLEKYNNSCQCCGWNKENPFTHKVPLELHHIDGNYKNNSEDNLQLLCPNCHSLTETYKAANKSGRKGRKKYN